MAMIVYEEILKQIDHQQAHWYEQFKYITTHHNEDPEMESLAYYRGACDALTALATSIVIRREVFGEQTSIQNEPIG